MAIAIWINIGSGNGLLPDGTKPLPEPMLTEWSSVKSTDIHIRAISQEMPQLSISKIPWKITYLKFHSNFPGANELTHWLPDTTWHHRSTLGQVKSYCLATPSHYLNHLLTFPWWCHVIFIGGQPIGRFLIYQQLDCAQKSLIKKYYISHRSMSWYIKDWWGI